MPGHDCVYATTGWGIHDERWIGALREVGLTPQAISLGRDATSTAQMRAVVFEAAGHDLPVLAGPLHTVTAELADLPIRLVGLSWGYDLSNLAASGADLAWLTALDGLVVDSTANRVIAERAGLATERITFLPWGVDLSVFTPDGPRMSRRELDLPEGTRIVLSLRAHEPIYRIADIVEAFARTEQPDLALVIGHSGSLTEDLRARAGELGVADRVRFIETVPESQLPTLLRTANGYITASEVDGTSVTMLQAMACGTAVIASDTPGNLGWIQDGVTGLTFPTGDVPTLAAAIDRVATGGASANTEAALVEVQREADWHANLHRLRAAMDGSAAP